MTEPRMIAGTKLTPEELAELDQIIERLGLGNRSRGLRKLVRLTIAANDIMEDNV